MAALDSSMVLNVSNAWVGIATESVTGTKPMFSNLANNATSIASWDFTQASALGFSCLGFTSTETDIELSQEREGGEKLGALQRPALRKTKVTQTWSLTVSALQLDNQVLSLTFGGGDITAAGYFGAPKTYTPQRKAVLLVLGDSAGYNMPIWLPLADVGVDGALTFGPSAITEGNLVFDVLDSDAAAHLLGIFRTGLGTAA